MLESFGTARQQFREEGAREAAFEARNRFVADHGQAAEQPMDPVLEEIALGCESYEAIQARLISLFEWSVILYPLLLFLMQYSIHPYLGQACAYSITNLKGQIQYCTPHRASEPFISIHSPATQQGVTKQF